MRWLGKNLAGRRGALVGAVLALVACSGAPESENLQVDNPYPPGWPARIQGSADECPEIEGRYHSGGTSNSNLGERFSNPIFGRTFFNLEEIANEDNSFEVKVALADKKIFFDIYDGSGNLTSGGHYKKFQRCENGTFVYGGATDGGSGDSPVVRSFSQTSIGVAIDGSLMADSRSGGEWNKLLGPNEVRTTGIWYRFERFTF